MKKIIIFLFAICITSGITAQKKTFMRIYDLQGKKIAKGYFAGTTDSTVLLLKEGTITPVPVLSIKSIKTKRSVGHTVLVCGGIAAVTMGVLSLAILGTDDFFEPISKEEIFVTGFASGAGGGTLIGAIAGSLKKSQEFKIDGKQENWQQQKILIDKVPVFNPTPAAEINVPAY
ncbi:MAG: hypothetical protein V4685_14165 [Bacteroidota bacterium]